jgi:diguanylate cyclase (GGDEF)-like protein/putative nucleotidyltransferase with HDIG domain
MTHHSLSKWSRIYVGSIIVVGVTTLTLSVYNLYADPIGWSWLVLAALTLLSGSATVKLPSAPATISVSETFVFTSVLLFGPSAGALIVALDVLVINLWLARSRQPIYRVIFNLCALPTALWLSAHLFYALAPDGLRPLSLHDAPINIGTLVLPLLAFTLSYFLLNSWLIAFAIALERGISALLVWRRDFAWLSLNYFGGASVAALLVTYTREIDFAYLAFVLPLLAVLYVTFAVSMGRVEDANRHLNQLNRLYMSTIETLAMAIDAKDQITHGHIRRVQHIAVGLANAIGIKDTQQIRAIEAASLLHDMGKLAVPEYILNKPGALTPAEFERMKLHASVGADILSAIEFPYPVVPIVRHHHENWDGSGYPDGLRGSDIPIGARVLSVADCFDALTSDRPYRPRLTDTAALKILQQRSGTMYDPLVVDMFTTVYQSILPPADDIEGTRTGLAAISASGDASDRMPATAGLSDISASTEEMLVLYDLAKDLAGRTDVADAGDLIAKHLRRIIPATTVVFYLYDEQSDEIVAAHETGESTGSFVGIRIPRGQRLSGWVAANRQTIMNSDPYLDLGEVARTLIPRLRSCLSVPLLNGDDLVGVLSIYSSRRQAFTDDHRRISEAIARQVSQTIRHAVRFEDQRRRGFVDRRSGLPNAQQLQRFIESELDVSGSGASVVMIHISWELRDSLSTTEHQESMAATLADHIRRAMRGGDVLFRLGSNELVALLTHTSLEQGEAVKNRIRAELSRVSAEMDSRQQPERVRVGWSCSPEQGKTVEGLVEIARRNSILVGGGHSQPPSVH